MTLLTVKHINALQRVIAPRDIFPFGRRACGLGKWIDDIQQGHSSSVVQGLVATEGYSPEGCISLQCLGENLDTTVAEISAQVEPPHIAIRSLDHDGDFP